jgi:peptidoglycan hydrolase CwlO-like protein
MDHTREIKDLEHGIRELEEAIEERMGAMPAHSFKPGMMQEIEELEEKLKEKRERLVNLRKSL